MLEQSPPFLSIQEMTPVTLNCTSQERMVFSSNGSDSILGKDSLTLIQSSQIDQADKDFKELLGRGGDIVF